MTQMFEFVGRPEIIVFGLGTVLFLTLYWLVRGAPVGQRVAREPSAAPSAGYRDRVVALAVLGFLLILGGAFVAGQYGILWSLLPFIAGFALILRVQRVNRKYRHVSPTLRRTLEFSQTALTWTLLGGVLIVGNVFAFRYGGNALDFTHDEAFSLSTLSIHTAEALERPLRLTLMFGRDEHATRQRDRVHQVAELYKAVNPDKIEIAEINTLNPRQAAELETLIKRNPDLAVNRGDAVVMEYGEAGSVDRAVIPVADLFRLANADMGSEGRISTSFTGEDAITSTIVRFREGKRKLVGFTIGHGEPSLDLIDVRELGLGLWKSRLAAIGIDAVGLNLIKDEVPASMSLLIIVAPRTPFQDQEIARLKAYLTRGGPLLVVMNGQVKTGLEEILALHNIAFEPGMIHDTTWNFASRTDQVVTPPLPRNDHPISQALVGLEFLIPKASPLKILGAGMPKPNEPKSPVNPAIIDYPIVRTSPTAWSELHEDRPAFVPGTDPAGPFIVGIAAAERSEVVGPGRAKPRLVVLSSPFLALNPALKTASTNLDLLQNSIQWLRGKEETLGVAPKVHTAIRFSADPNLRAKLHLVPSVISIVLILGFGVMTYLARRA